MGDSDLCRIPVRRLTARRLAASSVALVTLALTLVGASPLTARPLDEVVASKVLRVIVYEANKPFSYLEGGHLKGIDVDIGRGIAEKLGVQADVNGRMAGENVDDDLRANIWRGPLTGGGVGDVMLHVPVDRELGRRNELVVIGHAYFQHRIGLAVDPEKTGPQPSFEIFREEKVAVETDSMSDFFLLTAFGGQLRSNVLHFVKYEEAAAAFLRGETAGLMGTRAQLEGHLDGQMGTRKIVEPPMPGIVRPNWTIGVAFKTDSRDLGYAVGDALEQLHRSGELAAIFARHGVSYVRPPGS